LPLEEKLLIEVMRLKTENQELRKRLKLHGGETPKTSKTELEMTPNINKDINDESSESEDASREMCTSIQRDNNTAERKRSYSNGCPNPY
jgi:hypothetical protein